MKTLSATCTCALLLIVAGDLVAQRTTWNAICYGRSAKPEKVFVHYDACPMELPDSIALTTKPRIGGFVGWFSGRSPDEGEVRVAYEMPESVDTLLLAVVEAHCTESGELPMLVVRCGDNYGGVFGHLEGALLTDSLIAAGAREAFIKVRAENGELVPAQFVIRAASDTQIPGIRPFTPQPDDQ